MLWLLPENWKTCRARLNQHQCICDNNFWCIVYQLLFLCGTLYQELILWCFWAPGYTHVSINGYLWSLWAACISPFCSAMTKKSNLKKLSCRNRLSSNTYRPYSVSTHIPKIIFPKLFYGRVNGIKYMFKSITYCWLQKVKSFVISLQYPLKK